MRSGKRKAAEGSVKDEYGNARSLDGSQAHRDSVYSPPGTLSQIATVYRIQMKRFCRDRIFFFLIALILIVPIGVFLMEPLQLVESDVANTFMAAALMLAPIMGALVAALTCGTMVPQEFNERTAFMSMPLPMSRTAFCMGKFLAGLSLGLAVVLAAYGMAVFASSAVADVAYPGSMGTSMSVAVCTMFFYCAFTFMVSVFTKRTGTMISLLLLAAVMPALFVGIGFVIPMDFLGYLPFFGFDLSVSVLGMPPFGMTASVLGFLGTMAPFQVGSDAAVMCAAAMVLGVLFAVIGVMKVKRRDM